MHRLSQGVKGEDIGMPNCHRIEYYWLKGKLMHECKHCHKRIGLRVGTVMHGSEMPSQTWMYTVTMQLLSSRLPSAKSVIVDLGKRTRKPLSWMLLKVCRTLRHTFLVNQFLIGFIGWLFLFEESFHLAHRLLGGAFGLVDRVLWGLVDRVLWGVGH